MFICYFRSSFERDVLNAGAQPLKKKYLKAKIVKLAAMEDTEQMAKVLVSAALEQAGLEQEARRQQIQEGRTLQSEEREAPGEEVTHG